jgi:hypothetical protein
VKLGMVERLGAFLSANRFRHVLNPLALEASFSDISYPDISGRQALLRRFPQKRGGDPSK